MSKFVVIGSGALGSALANVIRDAGHENVCIVGIDQAELADLARGRNSKYFGPDLILPRFQTTTNLKLALADADYIVLAVPSSALAALLPLMSQALTRPTLIINGCKGFYPGQLVSVHTGIETIFQNHSLVRGCVSIVGPSFAQDLARRTLTMICAVNRAWPLVAEVQKLLTTPYFKLCGQTDVVGAEVGGIYKNILAIGAGLLTARGHTSNTLAAFLTRGLEEMQIFNRFMGGRPETIYGLTGLGDLILTATDRKSRNFSFGLDYGSQGRAQPFEPASSTIEGVHALEVVEQLRTAHNLHLPIGAALYQIVCQKAPVEPTLVAAWADHCPDQETN